MLDDDAGFAVDDALHLEADRPLGAGLELAHGPGGHRGVERAAVRRLADLVEFDPERPGHHPYLPAPHHGGDRGHEHHRLVVHGLPHAHEVADGVRLVVGGVVEDLLAADGVDGGAESAEQEREYVVAPPGVDTGGEERAAALRDGGEHRVAELGRGAQVVVERVQGRADDDRAGPDGAGDVGECLVGPDVSGRGVHHGPGAGGEYGFDVVGGLDPQQAVELAEFSRVAADLGWIVDDDCAELERGMGLDGTDRQTAHVAGTPDNRGNHARRVATGPLRCQSRAA